MKYLTVILILLASIGYSQGTKSVLGSFTKKPYAVPLGNPTTGKIDSSWLPPITAAPSDSARAAFKSDTSKAAYWATSLRGAVDTTRAAYKSDTSKASYWATALRSPADTATRAYWATAIRGALTLSGALNFSPDSTYDFGATSRPRNMFVGGYIQTGRGMNVGGNLTINGSGNNSIAGNMVWGTDSLYDIGSIGKPRDFFLARNASIGGTLRVNHGNSLTINADAAGTNTLQFWDVGSVHRWTFYKTQDAETGSNAGSNWAILAYSDAGSVLGNILEGYRGTGNINLTPVRGAVSIGYNDDNAVRATNILRVGGNVAITGTTTSDSVYARAYGNLPASDTARASYYATKLRSPADTSVASYYATSLRNGPTGAGLIVGRVAFSGTNRRVAVYIPGLLSTSNFICTGVSADGTTIPTLVMLPMVFLKTDSLVFIRGTGPSGEVVTYIGQK